MSIKEVISSPIPYVVWTALVLGALWSSYRYDPYLYAFTSLTVFWGTCAFTLVALFAVVLSREVTHGARFIVIGSLAISAAAIGIAFGVLGAFKWA